MLRERFRGEKSSPRADRGQDFAHIDDEREDEALQFRNLRRNPISSFLSSLASVLFWILHGLALVFIGCSLLLVVGGLLLPGYVGYYFNRFMDPDPVEKKFELKSQNTRKKKKPSVVRWNEISQRTRRHVAAYVESFFRQSSIHGLLYLSKRGLTLVEKLLWLLLLTVSLYFSVQNALQSLNHYHTKNTVVGVERDYYFWRTRTTSMTVCPMERLNVGIFDEFCRLHHIEGQRKTEFFDFLENLANSTFINFSRIPLYNSVDNILDELRIRPSDYMKLIYNLTGDRTLKSDSGPAVTIRNTVDELEVHVRQVLTEWGLCYMTNTVLGLELTAKYMIFGEVPEEYRGENVPSFEVNEATYFENDLLFSFKGFTSPMGMFIHSVYEVMHVNRYLGYYNNPVLCTVESMPIVTEKNYQEHTSISQRKCRFSTESNLEHYPIYTKTTCQQECRLNLAYELCKCIPHFYPNRVKSPKPVCSYKQLVECFPPYERALLEVTNPIVKGYECNCMENCHDSNIIIIKATPVYETSGLFSSLGAIVSMKKYPTLRLKRQILFTFTDLLVSIGGTAGLFLGFSVLGAIEFVYYFSMRLFWFLRGFKI